MNVRPFSVGLLAAGLAACAISACSSSPAAIATRCSGPRLAVPDSAAVSNYGLVLAPPVAAVPGAPRAAGRVARAPVIALDPANPGYGYVADGWRVSRVSSVTGRPAWSVVIHAPEASARADPQPDLDLEPHDGYVIVIGGDERHSYAAAVSATGRAGPACTLPEFVATDDHVELLPHAGVLIMSNPPSEAAGGGDSYLEAYAVATGRRLWSVSSGSAQAAGGATFFVAGDTAYVWQGGDGAVAAYDARTGNQRWNVNPGAQDATASDNGLLAVSDDRVLVLVDHGNSSSLVALRASDGSTAWKRGESQYAGPGYLIIEEVSPSELLLDDSPSPDASTGSSTVYLVRAPTGRILAGETIATRSLEPAVCTLGRQPAVALTTNDRIYVLSPDRRYDRTIVLPRSVDPTTVDVTASMAYVRAPGRGAPVDGYDLATGRRAWEVQAGGSPTATDVNGFPGGFSVWSAGRYGNHLFR